ncbi:MAG: N-acetylmuramoyl-L-alanine amidase family protein [Fusobacteriaceae bacterium]
MLGEFIAAMKKILVLFFGILLFNFSFSATQIQSVKNDNGNLVIEFAGSVPNYESTYDAKNRLIYLNFPKGNIGTAANLKNSSFEKNGVEAFQISDFGDSGMGIFIKHSRSSNYSLKKSGNELTISMNGGKSSDKKFTIVIDPGHGGKDVGANKFGKNEKNIVLKVALYLREELEGEFNVAMTRDRDVFVELPDRPKIANDLKADLFISIHVNAIRSPNVKGFETFYYSKQSSPYAARIAAYENSFGDTLGGNGEDISQILGELEYKKYQELSAGFAARVNSAIVKEMKGINRGVEGANFAVLRGLGRPSAVIPGVLVELGFLTNRNEMQRISNPEIQKRLAKTLAAEIRNYFY